MDAVPSDKEDEIDELMNDFDTKFIAPEKIKVTHNPENSCSLRLEENVLVAGQETCTLKT